MSETEQQHRSKTPPQGVRKIIQKSTCVGDRRLVCDPAKLRLSFHLLNGNTALLSSTELLKCQITQLR